MTIRKKIRKILREIFRVFRKGFYKSLGYYPAKIYGENYKLNYENLRFWEKLSDENWEPETFEVLSKYLNKTSSYIDIGAWIGPTVLFASKICKNIICFEPDPIAFQRLITNIHLNKLVNVSSFNLAISDKTSIEKMSSVSGGELGDSMTSLLSNRNKNSISFDAFVINWNEFEDIYNFEKIDFIKIDIEGGEFSLIPQMMSFFNKHKPIVWLSLHAPFLDENIREEQLKKIINVMEKSYSICLNSKFEKININELIDEDTLTQFPAFLFMN